MAINFFPFNPKAHVLWYSWAKVNVIIPSVNRQSPKNWVMNLRCFLLHFLTLLPINHSFLLSSYTYTFVPKYHKGGWPRSWGKEIQYPSSKLSIWGILWEFSHKGHPKRGARVRGGWGGKSPPLQLCHSLMCLFVLLHSLLWEGWGGGESSSRLWDKKSAV